MNYKVLLTTSGIGSRLGDLTKYTNKSLVRIGKKPAISYIVESYPEQTHFVVTVGYFGRHVRDFLEIAYPNRTFEFVEVNKYEGPGTSLGYSMLQAQEQLQCPFIYHACDTLVPDSTIPLPDQNWIGVYKGEDSTSYASWKKMGEQSLVFEDKGALDFDFLHIGLVGIHNYAEFWKSLNYLYTQNPSDSTLNDCQAINQMLSEAIPFTLTEFTSWFDIGNPSALQQARENIADHFDVLEKTEESIFLFDDTVIKFFKDSELVSRRVERAALLTGLVPKILNHRENFYQYEYVTGDVYSEVVTPKDFAAFLQWAKTHLWKENHTVPAEVFSKNCRKFYYNKTLKRVADFYTQTGIADEESVINDEVVPSIKNILAQIDFSTLCSGQATQFHGDCILENMIRTKEGYCLIDWRDSFGELTEAGDIYYDLAKLNHNLHVNHHIVYNDQFTIKKNESVVNCDILRPDNLVKCQTVLFQFIEQNGYDVKKVEILTGLIWLNMSSLHHHTFNLFLSYYGRLNLHRALSK